MAAPTLKTEIKAEMARGVARWATQMIAALFIFGAVLFLAAGRLDWLQGWAYLALNAVTQAFSALILTPRRPDTVGVATVAERSQVRAGTKGWDQFFAPAIVIIGTLAVLITAGLDAKKRSRTLQAELGSYREYGAAVRYRLVPGMW